MLFLLLIGSYITMSLRLMHRRPARLKTIEEETLRLPQPTLTYLSRHRANQFKAPPPACAVYWMCQYCFCRPPIHRSLATSKGLLPGLCYAKSIELPRRLGNPVVPAQQVYQLTVNISLVQIILTEGILVSLAL